MSNVEENSAPLPEIQDKWVYTRNGYIFEIQRTSFVHYRRFRLEDHIFSASINILDDTKEPPKLYEILGDLRSGIEQLIQNLQDIYRKSSPESHLYLLFQDQDSLAFSGLTTGNLLINEYIHYYFGCFFAQQEITRYSPQAPLKMTKIMLKKLQKML